jgi:hypothetical protein
MEPPACWHRVRHARYVPAVDPDKAGDALFLLLQERLKAHGVG